MSKFFIFWFCFKKFLVLLQYTRFVIYASQAYNIVPTTGIDSSAEERAISFNINMTDLPQAVGYGHGEILTPTLSQLDVLSLLFFLNFTTLYIFLIHVCFFNEAFQVLLLLISFVFK